MAVTTDTGIPYSISQSYSKPIMTIYHDAFNDDITGKSAGTTGCDASDAIG